MAGCRLLLGFDYERTTRCTGCGWLGAGLVWAWCWGWAWLGWVLDVVVVCGLLLEVALVVEVFKFALVSVVRQ